MVLIQTLLTDSKLTFLTYASGRIILNTTIYTHCTLLHIKLKITITFPLFFHIDTTSTRRSRTRLTIHIQLMTKITKTTFDFCSFIFIISEDPFWLFTDLCMFTLETFDCTYINITYRAYYY